MKTAKFWVTAEENGWLCYGWSDRNEAEARAMAQQRLHRVLTRAKSGPLEKYDYRTSSDGLLREPVLRSFTAAEAPPYALITRNRMGCLVLNTDDVVFVDVDVPPPPVPGLWARLRGQKAATQADAEVAYLRILHTWIHAHGAGMRVYRTAGGLRYLLTTARLSAAAPATQEFLTTLRADPQYRALCQRQNCFRARLTPKPWRCGLHDMQLKFPVPEANRAKIEAAETRWLAEYDLCAARYRTCELLETIGPDARDERITAIIALHDELTGIAQSLPLA
jgi:hypothetical protein